MGLYYDYLVTNNHTNQQQLININLSQLYVNVPQCIIIV